MTVLVAHNKRHGFPSAGTTITPPRHWLASADQRDDGATGWDRSGMAWAHPDPAYLNHWLTARNALLQTIEAATGRLPQEPVDTIVV